LAEGACPVETDPAVEVTCGTIAVPTDHDDPDGDTIDLAVAILPAADDSEATPIFLLGGGPGEHAVVPLLEMLAPDAPFLELAASRDVVVIDQRGAGASMPALECPEFQEELAEVTETAEIGRASIEAITVCRERLDGEGVDLSAFDTAAGVADLEAVRRALGYETVSLFGTSYGARLALQATREYPDTIESAALSSPIPAEENFVADGGDGPIEGLGRIDDEVLLRRDR
jgi:pimeloyl-ACP methyl ester carboxylesterase